MTAASEQALADTAFSAERLPGCIDLTALIQLDPRRYPFLLQSVSSPVNDSDAGGARFDILFAFPGDTLTLDPAGLSGPGAGTEGGGFLTALDAWWQRERQQNSAESDLPFTGGWFIYLGYELAGEVEPGLDLRMPEGLPTAFATRVPVALINDYQRNEVVLVAESGAASRLPEVKADLERSATLAASPQPDVTAPAEADPAEFIASVQRAQEYIRAGDIFQANLSRRWRARCAPENTALDLYRQLCRENPSPFAGILVHPDFAVISSSPERLVRRKGQRLDTRPIAGTRPREAGAERSEETRRDLLDNAKERAEHIMLIDLERNDLGRVCVGGTVQVDEFMTVESYSHVHHIVSNVTGTARPDLTPGELIAAVFPGGTITGCPKVRCMEIISELEAAPRGAYTGSMGYLNRNGDCDLNILIRTLTLIGDEIELAAGSGIVADSEPDYELAETRAKAKGLLLALGTNP